MQSITPHECSRIAQDLQIRKVQVESVVQLLDEGNTVPFITRYRKERTGGLNEEVIRQIQVRVTFLRNLHDRKQTILKTIQAQGKLTDELRDAILKADTTKRLEDLYLPYKPKKRSLATAARDKGLEPLALAVWHSDPAADNLDELLPSLVNPEKELAAADDVRLGVQHILAEMMAETAAVRAAARQLLWETGKVSSTKNEKLPEGQGLEYKDYFQFSEPARHIPAHRILALNRGEKEGAIKARLEYDPPAVATHVLPVLADHLLHQVGKMPAVQPPAETTLHPESPPAEAPHANAPPSQASPTETQNSEGQPVEGQPIQSGPEGQPPEGQPAESVPAPGQAPSEEGSPGSNGTPSADQSEPSPDQSSPQPTAPEHTSALPGANAPASPSPAPGASGQGADVGLIPSRPPVEMKGEPLVPDVPFKTPHADFLKKVFEDALQRLLLPSLEREIRGELTDEAEGHAASVFARNLRSLLLQPPLHDRRILAIDPGFRTGCKLAVLDEYGNLLEHAVIHPFTPAKKSREKKHGDSGRRPAPQAVAATAEAATSAPPPETTPEATTPEPAMPEPAASEPVASEPVAAEPTPAEPRAQEPKPETSAQEPTSEASPSPAETQPAPGPEGAPGPSGPEGNIPPEGSNPEETNPPAAPEAPFPVAETSSTQGTPAPETPPATPESLAPEPAPSPPAEEPAPPAVPETAATPAPPETPAPAPQPPAPPPPDRRAESRAKLVDLIKKHNIQVIALGNGTGCRETEEIVAEAIASDVPEVSYVIVNEAGASVYSVSPVGREEFPDLDSTTRGTVSIGRRLQDPLAELVKVDPQHIGVGLYQHDLGRKELKESLDAVVESCVNQVGVNVNTASIPLLRHVSGLNQMVARELIEYRKQHGPFQSRESLQQVSGLGPQRFTQAAGFLKVPQGPNPLDRAWIHPESYPVAEKILEELGYSPSVLDDRAAHEELKKKLGTLSAEDVARRLNVGVPTVQDILDALARPGLDPREELPPPIFKKGILKVEDLQPGMELKGTVLNVVDFGAFVDIGLKDSGLVHISQMANRYIKSPYDVVAVNDVVTVWVLSVDKERNRVSLSMIKPGTERRPQERGPGAPRGEREGGRPPRGRGRGPRQPAVAAAGAPAQPGQEGQAPTQGGRPPRGRQGGGQGGGPGRGPGRGGRPAHAGEGRPGDRPQEQQGQGRQQETRPAPPPRRPRREPPKPKLSQDALEGKVPLRTFGELSALFAAKTKEEAPPPRETPKPETVPQPDAPPAEAQKEVESSPPTPANEQNPAEPSTPQNG